MIANLAMIEHTIWQNMAMLTDGAHKYQTIIKDGGFIGSDTQLIAPVTVNENATIAAGSTICKDVPAGGLTLTEAKQKTLPDWIRPTKEQK